MFVVAALATACRDANREVPVGTETPRASVTQRVMFAVARADSVLVPFAGYDAGVWLAPGQQFPGDSTGSVADLADAWFAVAGVPAKRWFAQIGTDSIASLQAGAARKVAAHCRDAWGLAAVVAGSVLGQGEHHSNVGIAADVDGVLVPAATVGDSSATWIEISALIRATFAASESAYMAVQPDWLRVHFAEPPNGRFAIQVTAISAPPSAVLYRVVAEGDYGEPPTQGGMQCPATSRLNSWARRDSTGRLSLFAMTHDADLCDRKRMPDVRVLGAATFAGSTFVFVEEHFYEWEKYVIHEISGSRARRVLVVDAGGC